MVYLNHLERVCCTVTGADPAALWTRVEYTSSHRLECVAAREIFVFLTREYGVRSVELNVRMGRGRHDATFKKMYSRAIRKASNDDDFKGALFAAHRLYKEYVISHTTMSDAAAEMIHSGMSYEGQNGGNDAV